MTTTATEAEPFTAEILRVIGTVKGLDTPPVGGQEDVFAAYGLNSMDTFAAIVALENTFGIIFGDDPSDFEKIRTLTGLEQLVTEKVRANQAGDVISGATEA